MSTQQKRDRRNKLFSENPHCHWCGVRVFLPPRKYSNPYPPSNLATLDHLRFWPYDLGREITVLSCYGCNQFRGKIAERRLMEINIIVNKTKIKMAQLDRKEEEELRRITRDE